MTYRSASFLLAALALACGTPTAPQEPGTSSPPSPAPVQEPASLSGIVTDEGGAPISGASVGVSFAPGGGSFQRTTTDANGRYEFNLAGLYRPASVSAHNGESGNVQLLDWSSGTTQVKNIRLRRHRIITAGESFEVAIEPDSSICVWEFHTSGDSLCEWFSVRFDAPARVTIDARPIRDPAVLPLVGWANPGTVGTASFTFEGDDPIGLGINLAVPRGAAPQRYLVTTSLQR